jgi:hypothetical protein
VGAAIVITAGREAFASPVEAVRSAHMAGDDASAKNVGVARYVPTINEKVIAGTVNWLSRQRAPQLPQLGRRYALAMH